MIGICKLPVVQQEKTYFKVDKIPRGLTFIETMSFCNTLRDSTEGCILKSYRVSNYVVHVYTKNSYQQKFCSLLIEKINCLLEIIDDSVEVEIWIVKEKLDYSCFGIFKNVPVFFKSFNTIDDIQHNIQEMQEHMQKYAGLSCIRTFGLDPSGMNFGKIGIFEYSSGFLRNKLKGHSNLNEYCINAYSQRIKRNRLTCGLLILNLVANLLSFGAIYMNKKINQSIVILQKDSSTDLTDRDFM